MLRLSLVAGALALAGHAAANLPIYQSNGFEAGTFNVGPIAGQDGWAKSAESTVDGTANVVEDGTAQSGSRYVRLTSGAVIERQFNEAAAQTADRIWVEGYFRGAGSTVQLQDANYPADPPASAIVHFSSEVGVQLQNGAAVRNTSVPVGANKWLRISMLLDFNSKTYDVWILDPADTADLVKEFKANGFKSATVTRLSGFKNLSQTQSDFDAFRIVVPISGDANGDTKVDAADLVAIIENITSDSQDIIIFKNGDLNGDESLTLEGDAVPLAQAIGELSIPSK